MDYIDFCRKYYAATRLPLVLIEDRIEKYSTIGDLLSLPHNEDCPDLTAAPNPFVFFYSQEILYGCVRVEATNSIILIEPIFEVPMTEHLIDKYMKESDIPFEHKEKLSEFLYAMPKANRISLAHHLSLLHLILNGKNANLREILPIDYTEMEKRETSNMEKFMEHKDFGNFHTTYYTELQLYDLIRAGIPEKLIQFMNSNQLNFFEKKLARSPVRQAKNLFISIATNVAMIGAIPGGVDVEKAYYLVDQYVQECEQLQTVEDIAELQNQMFIDFCKKAGESHIPNGISSDVYVCMNYIRKHTNESISIDDVAWTIRRSVSFISKKFKSELGISPGQYINKCKLEEAKALLTYTDQTLSEIGNYLCFSSQAHFQNAFKKMYEITPLQYRQKTQVVSE